MNAAASDPNVFSDLLNGTKLLISTDRGMNATVTLVSTGPGTAVIRSKSGHEITLGWALVPQCWVFPASTIDRRAVPARVTYIAVPRPEHGREGRAW